ncbi:MAG: phosphatidylglycerophosphatase A [Candidatus Rokubacteria bacterium]|nr:phosphatidylglycerophosphatase A [Candidatus Rokubacteria bacterium]
MASSAGAGYFPVAPGTAGSLVAAVGLWLIPFSRVGLWATLAAVVVAGIWASHRVEAVLERKDPGVIVIDEVAGMMVAVLLLPRTLGVLLCAFLLFRLFDIWKPFPAGEAQALRGGFGVVADDLIAGVYSLVLIMGARMLFGVPR